MKARAKLLIFDKVDKMGYLCPSDMEISFPEKVPVMLEPKMSPTPNEVIGNASVSRVEDGLEVEIKINDDAEDIVELINGGLLHIGGYYRAVNTHKEGYVRVIDSARLLCAFTTFGDIYGNHELLIRVGED